MVSALFLVHQALRLFLFLVGGIQFLHKRLDPCMLPQLDSRWALFGIDCQALSDKINTQWAELRLVWQCGRLLRHANVEHDCPLIIKIVPWPRAFGTLENHAAQTPDVHRILTSLRLALYDLGRHVHRRALQALSLGVHGTRLQERRASAGAVRRDRSPRQHLGSTKVDKFDDAHVVQQNVVRLDVSVDHALRVEIHESIEHLERIDLEHNLVFDATMLQKLCKTTALAVFFKNVHLLAMHLNAIVLNNVGMPKHLHHIHLVVDLLEQIWRRCQFLEPNLLDSHEATRIEVDREVHSTKCTTTNEPSLLPAHLDAPRCQQLQAAVL